MKIVRSHENKINLTQKVQKLLKRNWMRRRCGQKHSSVLLVGRTKSIAFHSTCQIGIREQRSFFSCAWICTKSCFVVPFHCRSRVILIIRLIFRRFLQGGWVLFFGIYHVVVLGKVFSFVPLNKVVVILRKVTFSLIKIVVDVVWKRIVALNKDGVALRKVTIDLTNYVVVALTLLRLPIFIANRVVHQPLFIKVEIHEIAGVEVILPKLWWRCLIRERGFKILLTANTR